MTSTTVRTTSIETPAGPVRLAVAVDDAGERVVALAFDDHFDRVTAKVRARFVDVEWVEGESAAADAVRRYLAGDLAAVDDLTVDATGTPFQEQVWAVLRSIPAGETRSYAEVAVAVGSPGAVRAVGSANGANPIWLVVPCHRVVRSDGSVGGYGGGADRKEWLLDHERSTMAAKGTNVTSPSTSPGVKVAPDRP